jgi:4-hydroxybenzoate polyprenyltransferase
MGVRSQARGLAMSAHPGPSLAVTFIATAFALSAGLDEARVALVAAGVLAGQLSVGWSNDIIDASRDRVVGRRDKPLATGALSLRTARSACGIALVAVVLLSLLWGLAAGVVHLACVAVAWAYNLGIKATALSWLPFAVAFGGLPTAVMLAGPGASLPPVWIPVSGALLGVGAHFLNVLPDLRDDEHCGIRGLPHRLGQRWVPVVAVTLLATATTVIAMGTTSVPPQVLAACVIAVSLLAMVALVGGGRVPFQAAMAIAVLDVLLLLAAT